MRSVEPVIDRPDFSVRVVTCADDRPGWSEPEPASAAGVVLARRGMFRLRGGGHRQTVDPTMGYLQTPGEEYRYAHPAGGDVCTFIGVREPLWDVIAGEWSKPRTPAVRVDGRVELAHRLLLRTVRDAADPAERLVHTIAAALRPPDRPRRSPGSPALADRAREAILAADPASSDLVRLARALGVSPSHLSRTFRAHVGMTVSRYRNRVRVSRALALLEQGRTDLAALAADVGFADQSHLTRAVRAELGHPPGRLRALFTEPAPADARAGRSDRGRRDTRMSPPWAVRQVRNVREPAVGREAGEKRA